jgi:hypothetical protein
MRYKSTILTQRRLEIGSLKHEYFIQKKSHADPLHPYELQRKYCDTNQVCLEINKNNNLTRITNSGC